MKILDYRDNPVEITFKDEKLSFNKIELLKKFVDSYICNCNGVLDNEPYEKIIEWLDGDAFVSSFESAVGLEGEVLPFAREYYKNYM
ncbi:hypothetical protein CP985_13575 [Malaciobacter mytili LMG 24559]|uniref:Uncharacterized protein n=1 Tax=Malaciobacter mytili LMG 24559 TaxID=1032238 RepID=A0AAX2ADZ3_9BACT|nr:hypothetical protein [Malaciobacter mytili]AXH16458.1 hypothetical protein AMYT_a0160 [Malaciobacter mytili LMG 24559]RXK12980.1 hypothetical protein CP985_13575 [Malaciobacter mytili LMG 24559]